MASAICWPPTTARPTALYGYVRRTELLAFCRYLRTLHPTHVGFAIVLDNFSHAGQRRRMTGSANGPEPTTPILPTSSGIVNWHRGELGSFDRTSILRLK